MMAKKIERGTSFSLSSTRETKKSRGNAQEEPFLSNKSLIDFLHPGSVLVVALERWHVVVAGNFLDHLALHILVESEAELDHAVNAAGMYLGVFEPEAGSEEGGFVEKHDQILDRVRLLSQRLHDWVLWIDFQLFLGGHVS